MSSYPTSASRKIEEIIGRLCLQKMKLPTLPLEEWEASISWMIKAMELVIKYSFKGVGGREVAYGRIKVFAPEAEEADILGLLLSKEGYARERLLREMATGWLS